MTQIITAYPFLVDIPIYSLTSLELNEIYLPTEDEQNLLSELTILINHHLVFYKPNFISNGRTLCQTIKVAELTTDKIRILKSFENNFKKDVILVAYNKPLKMIRG